MPVTYPGIARQFALDWKAAMVGRGNLDVPAARTVDWYPNASAATRALRRLLANLEVLDVDHTGAAAQRLQRDELSDEARRVMVAVPAPGTRDQGAIQALWAACDVLMEHLQQHAARETTRKAAQAADSPSSSPQGGERGGFLFEPAEDEFVLNFRPHRGSARRARTGRVGARYDA